MSRGRASRGERRSPRDAGVTLVEVLVAMVVFGIFSTVLLGFALSTATVTEEIRATADVTEESRLAIERMSRELRQASAVEAVTLEGVGSSSTTALTIWTDFNGNQLRDLSDTDPEVLTYRWQRSTGRLTLTADDSDGTAVTRPVLAEIVTRFDLRLRSSMFEADTNGDGTTTWQELDGSTAAGGNRNGVPDGDELDRIDLVAVSMTVSDADARRDFALQADLRNQDGG